MNKYVKILLKSTYKTREKINSIATENVIKGFKNSDKIYQKIWERIMEQFKYEDDKEEVYKFTFLIENTNYITELACTGAHFETIKPSSDYRIKEYFDTGFRIDLHMPISLDRLVNSLIKDGFDINLEDAVVGNILEVEITSRQVKFLSDSVGYEKNVEGKYYKLNLPKEDEHD